MRQDNQAAIVAIPANIQTTRVILAYPATHVGQVNTHQMHLLAAETALWEDIRTKTTLIKPHAKHADPVNTPKISKVLVETVQVARIRARRLPLLTTALLARQACMYTMHLHLVRLALQASTMMRPNQA